MRKEIPVEMHEQPDNTTCGPTCLDAVYRFHGKKPNLKKIISEVEMLDEGGTVAPHLARHALNRGFAAELYSFNLHVFDPTWFELSAEDLILKLNQQTALKPRRYKLKKATEAYKGYLASGGDLRFYDITPELIRSFIDRDLPIISGLSSTFLYRCMREHPQTTTDDDIGGEPAGHFVVVNGYDTDKDTVLIADPYKNSPFGSRFYETPVLHFISAVYLGVVTYDTNLLVIKPRSEINS